MAQLINHHIVNDGMRYFDDVPVEGQLPSGGAGTPAGLDVADADS